MKKLQAAVLFLLATCGLLVANPDVVYNLADFSGAATVKKVRITPINAPSVIGSNIVDKSTKEYTNFVNGSFTVTNMAGPLAYLIEVYSGTAITPFTNAIPDTNGTIYAKNCIGAPLPTDATVGYTRSQADSRFVLKTNGSAFGLSASNTTLKGTLTIPTGAAAGRVLTSDSSGNATWTTPTGGGTGGSGAIAITSLNSLTNTVQTFFVTVGGSTPQISSDPATAKHIFNIPNLVFDPPLNRSGNFVTLSPISNANVASSAAIAESKLALNFATHSNANDPSSGEKAALAGTSGTPGSGNKYVTDSDSRLTNSRTPSGSAGGDLTGTYPNPTLTATGTAGTYTKVTTDSKGRVTSGSSLSAGDIPALNYATNINATVTDSVTIRSSTAATLALTNSGAVANFKKYDWSVDSAGRLVLRHFNDVGVSEELFYVPGNYSDAIFFPNRRVSGIDPADAPDFVNLGFANDHYVAVGPWSGDQDGGGYNLNNVNDISATRVLIGGYPIVIEDDGGGHLAIGARVSGADPIRASDFATAGWVNATYGGNNSFVPDNTPKFIRVESGRTVTIFGDSISTALYGDVTNAGNYWVNILASMVPVNNQSVGGISINGQAPNIMESVVNDLSESVVSCEINNFQNIASTNTAKEATLTMVREALMLQLATPDSNKITGASGKFTASGTWDATPKFSMGIGTTEQGATLAITNLQGSTLGFVFEGYGIENGVGGQFNLYVDGDLIGTYSTVLPTDIYDLNDPGGDQVDPFVIWVTNLDNVTHTAVIEVASETSATNNVVLDFVTRVCGSASTTGPLVYVAGAAGVSPEEFAFYGKPEQTLQSWDTYNRGIESSCRKLTSYGLKVDYLRGWYDGVNIYSGISASDKIHPNDEGQLGIARGILGQTLDRFSLRVGRYGTPILTILATNATLNFGSTSAGAFTTLTTPLVGVGTNGNWALTVTPQAPLKSGTSGTNKFDYWVSATNTISIQYQNASPSTVDPPSAKFSIVAQKTAAD